MYERRPKGKIRLQIAGSKKAATGADAVTALYDLKHGNPQENGPPRKQR
jgi:hypothetical protein